MISDSMGKKLKVVVGEMGIETDEETNVFLPVVLVEKNNNNCSGSSSSSSNSSSGKKSTKYIVSGDGIKNE